MPDYNWPSEFEKTFNKAVGLYREGRRGSETFFDRSDLAFLQSIGCTAQELYDFAEDFCNHGEPDFNTALQIAAERRDYFLREQGGRQSGKTVPMSSLPAKTDSRGSVLSR